MAHLANAGSASWASSMASRPGRCSFFFLTVKCLDLISSTSSKTGGKPSLSLSDLVKPWGSLLMDSCIMSPSCTRGGGLYDPRVVSVYVMEASPSLSSSSSWRPRRRNNPLFFFLLDAAGTTKPPFTSTPCNANSPNSLTIFRAIASSKLFLTSLLPKSLGTALPNISSLTLFGKLKVIVLSANWYVPSGHTSSDKPTLK